MPGYTGSSSVLDVITRTYKNAAGDTIAIQKISVRVETISTQNRAGMNLTTPESLELTRFKRTGRPVLTTSRSIKSGASAVISSVVTEGSFDTYTVVSSDITEVVYVGVSPVNSLTIPVNSLSGVFKIGDTV
jgi:hypothetical protein